MGFPMLVLFKDLLEENSEPQYGILENRDEPNVICLCCGGVVEFGDYEIIEELAWQDLSTLLKAGKEKQKFKFVVCIDSCWIRDAQLLDTKNLTDEEFNGLDFYDCDTEDRWHDAEPNQLVAIIEADSEEDACIIAAEKYRYDRRCLYAIKI